MSADPNTWVKGEEVSSFMWLSMPQAEYVVHRYSLPSRLTIGGAKSSTIFCFVDDLTREHYVVVIHIIGSIPFT